VRCSRWILAPRVDRYWCSRQCFVALREMDPDYKQRLGDLEQLAYGFSGLSDLRTELVVAD
jgi:hypothetical protein